MKTFTPLKIFLAVVAAIFIGLFIGRLIILGMVTMLGLMFLAFAWIVGTIVYMFMRDPDKPK